MTRNTAWEQAEIRVGDVLEGAGSLHEALPGVLRSLADSLAAERVEFWAPGPDGLTFHSAEGQDSTFESSEAPVPAPARRARESGAAVVEMGPGTSLAIPAASQTGFSGVILLRWRDPIADPEVRRFGGTIARLVAAFIRRASAEASHRQAQLLAQEASESKSQFLANMSHEIRTPMTAILGYTDMLAHSLEDPDDRQVLGTIRRNGQHLLDIVNDILDLSKIEAGRLDIHANSFAPAAVAGDVVKLMSLRAAEQGLSLSLRFDTELPDRIVSDRVRIRQVLINLVGNAIKFTEAGNVAVRIAKVDDTVQFRVEDTGIGMEPEALDRLFESFVQGDTSSVRPYQGTGLGLTISDRLARALGGFLRAESQPGEGSSFTLTVPIGHEDYELVTLDEEAFLTEAGYEAPNVKPRRIRGRILAVDDRLDLRLLLRQIFEESGATVEVATTGREALDLALTSGREGRPFDAIIMDLQMPEMDGTTAIRQLRRMGYDGTIVALTAGALIEDRERAFAAGCDEFVTKPVDGPSLVDLVWRMIHGDEADEEPVVDATAVPKARLLLIEDDRDVSELLKTLFEGWGCSVRVAHTGAEALREAAREPVDVIFSDLNLPDMPGVELLPMIRQLETCHDCICVSLSGQGGSESERLSREAGFSQHLVKPARFEDLKAVITRVEARLEG